MTVGDSPGLVIEFHGNGEKICSVTVLQAAMSNASLGISSSAWLEVMLCICSAFEYIHNSGILHNDIKASNVLLAFKIS